MIEKIKMIKAKQLRNKEAVMAREVELNVREAVKVAEQKIILKCQFDYDKYVDYMYEVTPVLFASLNYHQIELAKKMFTDVLTKFGYTVNWQHNNKDMLEIGW